MMNGWGFGLAHMVFWIIALIAVVVGAMWLVRSSTGQVGVARRSSGLDVLEERYARGEIERE